jgi:predicted DsbA family dithiol-disulfide isomerase
MDMRAQKPKLNVQVFSDYICPFCFIGSLRLLRLSNAFDLQVAWQGIELHPETPPTGMPVSELGYPAQQWLEMMNHLRGLAAEDGIMLAELDFTTNSRKALLLAEAAKEAGRTIFYRVHARLFRAMHTEGLNIGDERTLRRLAGEAGLADELVEAAWRQERFANRLRASTQEALRLGIKGVPTYVIGEQVITGAVSFEELYEAAEIVAGVAA